MADSNSKKWAYMFLAVSAALLVMNFSIATFDRILIPNTSTSIPAGFLWFGFLFLLIPFTNEVRESNLKIGYKIEKQFKRYLTRWSRKKKDRQQQDLYTPQFLLTRTGAFGLNVVCRYCQVDPDKEPFFSVTSTPIHSLLFFMKAFFKTVLSFELLDRITLPCTIAGLAVIIKSYKIIHSFAQKP